MHELSFYLADINPKRCNHEHTQDTILRFYKKKQDKMNFGDIEFGLHTRVL